MFGFFLGNGEVRINTSMITPQTSSTASSVYHDSDVFPEVVDYSDGVLM